MRFFFSSTAKSSKSPNTYVSAKPVATIRESIFEPLEDRRMFSAISAEYAATAKETDAYGTKVQAILGTATSPELSVPGVSGATMQTYHNSGAIYYSAKSGAHVVFGSIGYEYAQTAKETDAYGTNVQKILGLPTSDETNFTPVAGARVNYFSGGSILFSAKTGSHVLYGSVAGEYAKTASETDDYGSNVQKILGLPTTDEANFSSISGARVTQFQGGSIYWSGSTGAHALYGSIGAEYLQTAKETDIAGINVQKIIGLPTADEANYSRFSGARVTTFSGGSIFFSAKTGSHVLYGQVASEYAETALEADAYNNTAQTVLGLPTTDENSFSGFSGARVSQFQDGSILYSGATGAHAIYGAIASEFAQLAHETDVVGNNSQKIIGLPTTDEGISTVLPGVRQQNFQGGAISWTAKTGAHALYGSIGSKYWGTRYLVDAYGTPIINILGNPTADETPISSHPGARAQEFQGGFIYWSSQTGTHAVIGAIASAYFAHGGPTGTLGLPTSDELSSDGSRYQNFQNGFIDWNPTAGTRVYFS